MGNSSHLRQERPEHLIRRSEQEPVEPEEPEPGERTPSIERGASAAMSGRLLQGRTWSQMPSVALA